MLLTAAIPFDNLGTELKPKVLNLCSNIGKKNSVVNAPSHSEDLRNELPFHLDYSSRASAEGNLVNH